MRIFQNLKLIFQENVYVVKKFKMKLTPRQFYQEIFASSIFQACLQSIN